MLPEWLVVLAIVVILSLDVLLVFGLGALAILLVVFRIGKLAYDLIDRTIARLVHQVLCFLEDLLESHPFKDFPILSCALVAVKIAYDLINAFQNGIERLIAVIVVLAAMALGIACVCALAILNAMALWLVLSYHLI